MAPQHFSSDSFSKISITEKRSSLKGISETKIRRYMNGAISFESATESDSDLRRNIKPGKLSNSTHQLSNSCPAKKLSLVKIIDKNIQEQMAANEIAVKEIRMQKCEVQYKAWLEKKKKEQAERNRIEMEKLRKKENQLEAEKHLRTVQSDLSYKLWLKRKEQEELERKWKELRLLMKKLKDK